MPYSAVDMPASAYIMLFWSLCGSSPDVGVSLAHAFDAPHALPSSPLRRSQWARERERGMERTTTRARRCTSTRRR